MLLLNSKYWLGSKPYTTDVKMGETYLVDISKIRQVLTPQKKSMKVSDAIKNDALTCKDWTNSDMIECVDTIIRKETSGFDCQLPMSMKIGIDSHSIYVYS
jgi:hypothetical protein